MRYWVRNVTNWTHGGRWYCNLEMRSREMRNAKYTVGLCQVPAESGQSLLCTSHFAFRTSVLWSAACSPSWGQWPSCLSQVPRGRRPTCLDGRSTTSSAPAVMAAMDAEARWDLASSCDCLRGRMPSWRRSCGEGVPAKGMPGVALAQPELRQLLAFLRTLRAPDADASPRLTVETLDGATLDGVALNQSSVDLQLLDRRRPASVVAPVGQPLPPRVLRRGLAWLSRIAHRKSLQPPRPDHERQRRAAGAGVDVHDLGRERLEVTPVVVGRGNVRHQRQRVLCARCGIGPPDLAFPATAHQGAGRRRRRRDQSRCGGRAAIACSWSPIMPGCSH